MSMRFMFPGTSTAAAIEPMITLVVYTYDAVSLRTKEKVPMASIFL